MSLFSQVTPALEAYASCAAALLELQLIDSRSASGSVALQPALPTPEQLPGTDVMAGLQHPARASGGIAVSFIMCSEELGTISEPSIAARRSLLRMKQLLALASEEMAAGRYERAIGQLMPLAFPGRGVGSPSPGAATSGGCLIKPPSMRNPESIPQICSLIATE